MQAPKKIVHSKVFNTYGQRRRGMCNRGNSIAFGEFGLMATSTSWITARQIESARRVISRRTKGGKVYIRIFASNPVTSKGLGVPMGSGKGSIDKFVYRIKPGRVIFEVNGIPKDRVTEAFRIAGHKLPVLTKMISKDDLF